MKGPKSMENLMIRDYNKSNNWSPTYISLVAQKLHLLSCFILRASPNTYVIISIAVLMTNSRVPLLSY